MEQACRLCLGSKNRVFPLYTTSELSQRIEQTFGIQIDFNDQFPKNICIECYKCVIQAYSFRNIIINANNQLEKMLHNGKVEIEPKEFDLAVEIEDESSSSNSEDNIDDSDNLLNCKIEPNPHEEDISQVNIKTEVFETKDDANAYENHINPDLYSNDIDPSSLVTTEHRIPKPRKKAKPKPTDWPIKPESHYCEQCNVYCTTKYKLKMHKGRHRTLCNVCGKSFTAYNLQKHITMVHTFNPVNCKYCDKVFKNRALLFYHERAHNLSKLKCEHCNKMLSRTAFNRHRRIHLLGESKPEKCTLCEKAFYIKEELTRHMRSHTGERPYPCQVCKKGFSSSNALKTHTRQHTNERPYKCDQCPAAFIANVSLKTHLKSKHNIELK